MKYLRARLVKALIDYFEDDLRRIDHALKVLKEADILAAKSKKRFDKDILSASAILHDAGIKISEAELGYNDGKTQEKYGPPEVEKILKAIEFPPHKIKIVCDITGNHHSPSKFEYNELEILKAADRIVNLSEKGT